LLEHVQEGDAKFAASANGHHDFEKYQCNEVTEDLVMTTLPSGAPVYRYDGASPRPMDIGPPSRGGRRVEHRRVHDHAVSERGCE
jgi:hypothetical protein